MEKASFMPLVFMATGGMSKECSLMNKRIVEMISEKTKDKYSQVMRHNQTRLQFAPLKATLVAVLRYRGKKGAEANVIDFNSIPEEKTNEKY